MSTCITLKRRNIDQPIQIITSFYRMDRTLVCPSIWQKFSMGYWPFVRGIHRSPVNSTHKGQWHGALIFSLICAWINAWVYYREVGDLRRHCTHYDVIVMSCIHQSASLRIDLKTTNIKYFNSFDLSDLSIRFWIGDSKSLYTILSDRCRNFSNLLIFVAPQKWHTRGQ